MDLVLTLQPHTANYHECCKGIRPTKAMFSQPCLACKSPTKKTMDFLCILSSSPFLECTVGVDFCGAALKTCTRSEGKARKRTEKAVCMISLLSAMELLGMLQMMFAFRMHPFNNGSHTTKSSESGL